MLLGIDVLLNDSKRRKALTGKRIALLGHPASVTHSSQHSLDALMSCSDLRVSAAFGPQHGMLGDRQDNMMESYDYTDPHYHIPVFSLYGHVRRPTLKMMETFDVLLVDLQDIGTRIYTFVTTCAYMLEACAVYNKSIWILDRPNPAGRPVEGTLLQPGWESFVGVAPMLMRHGLTHGEFARWFVDLKKLNVDLDVVKMNGYRPGDAPGYGWPVFELSWVNPSPNASSLNMARCFPGTVLFEGTTLSEGRGTTHSLELFGAPDIDSDAVLNRMNELAPEWLKGCWLRRCYFEPTFHKHTGKLCAGIQIHTDNILYHHEQFRPYRIAALALKSIRHLYPEYKLWREYPYEYEKERLAIDLLSGSTFLREWVDKPAATIRDLETRLIQDEACWSEQRKPYLVY
jgi:uncharacterized protein YbbC (DUF1343 family)